MNGETSIIVNGQKKTLTGEEVSFDELVKIAFPDLDEKKDIYFVVTYEGGVRKNPEGILGKGDLVEVKEGMVFNVTPTDNS